MLIGRGKAFAWTLTSAGADIIDTYAETLCGGSKTKYLFKGRCRSMEKVAAGTISFGAAKTSATFHRTVHGPVIGYATDATTGKTVALSRRRSTYGRETVDLLFNQQLTYGRVHNAREFVKAAQKPPQTFNSFYVSATESAFTTTGLMPMRPAGVNPTLPVDGRGTYEWRGFLSAAAHPSAINPASGLIVNWNNKPAKDFPAGDGRFGSEGGLQRNLLLTTELARYPKAKLADAAMCTTLGEQACSELRGMIGIFDAPLGGGYGGWHQYMWKDLRSVLGQSVTAPYTVRYCGAGVLATCAGDLWAAIAAGAAEAVPALGADPAAWQEAVTTVGFSPVSRYTMQWTNRPSGIHQVMSFGQ
ncbi:unannotated protein [freshwater metagenome]|uniref:Unannotated protein n=1 Tax=freshwater metagenome TaxID=449393 RepID=A0A6J7J486_9ZZZZ